MIGTDNTEWHLYTANHPDAETEVQFRRGKHGEVWRGASGKLGREFNVWDLWWRPIAQHPEASIDNTEWRLYRAGNLPEPVVKAEFRYGKYGEVWRSSPEDLLQESDAGDLYWRHIQEEPIPQNESELELLRRLARDMLNRLDEIAHSKSLNGVFQIAAVHGVRYQGSYWHREYNALKKALEG